MPTRRKRKSTSRKRSNRKVLTRSRKSKSTAINRSKSKVKNRSKRRSKRKSKTKSKKYDGVGFDDISADILTDNIYEYLSCFEQRNLFLSSRDYIITSDTCPEVKFRYIVRSISDTLRELPEEDRKDFLLKLKVYICLNPTFIPSEYTFASISTNLTNIDLIKATTINVNINNINVLNCPVRQFPVHLKQNLQENLTLYMKPLEYAIPFLFNGLGGMRPFGDNTSPNTLPIRSVAFYGFEQILGDNICRNQHYLERISYAGLSSLKSIGNGWMTQCQSLRYIDFRGLISLERVGYSWLSGCQNLREVNFNGLSELKTVAGLWINNCPSLVALNFNGLFSLKSVGYNWLSHCESLINPNFDGLISLQTVDGGWLNYCHSLRSPNFNGLTSIQEIGEGWMEYCPSLQIRPEDLENPILRQILVRELNDPHRNFVSTLVAEHN